MLIMDLGHKQLEGTGKDKENAQGNLGTSCHSESFVDTSYGNIPKTPHGMFKAKTLQ